VIIVALDVPTNATMMTPHMTRPITRYGFTLPHQFHVPGMCGWARTKRPQSYDGHRDARSCTIRMTGALTGISLTFFGQHIMRLSWHFGLGRELGLVLWALTL